MRDVNKRVVPPSFAAKILQPQHFNGSFRASLHMHFQLTSSEGLGNVRKDTGLQQPPAL
jgi:hypothetical protein